MIKVTELQIGDWVQNPLGWKAQVQSIRYVNTIKDELEWLVKIGLNSETFQNNLSLNEIDPIPLMSEMLEKNGFTQCEPQGYDLYVKSKEGAGLYHIFWQGEPYNYLEIAAYASPFGEFNKSNIKYVHELQHALRLCGIEHEITL